MRRTKFNGDYAGEIILVGFTGNSKLIQDYLKKTFHINPEDKYKMWSKKEQFNIEVAPHVVAHVEIYPWTGRESLKVDKIKKEKK